MKKSGYLTATIEEFLALPKEDTVIAIPARAISEIEIAKKSKSKELVTRAIKKYIINARQAQTNAKIVEALLA